MTGLQCLVHFEYWCIDGLDASAGGVADWDCSVSRPRFDNAAN